MAYKIYQIKKNVALISVGKWGRNMCEKKIVISGDILPKLSESEQSGKIVLGPGLKRDKGNVVATKSGVIRHKEPNVYWIDSHQKRVSF